MKSPFKKIKKEKCNCTNALGIPDEACQCIKDGYDQARENEVKIKPPKPFSHLDQ